MMGYSHALSGAVAASAIYAFAPETLGPTTSAAAISSALIVGGALLPDADHPNASAARSFPPLSNVMVAGISKVSGGHRGYTHTLLGVGIFAALTYFACTWQADIYGHQVFPLALLIVAFCVSLGLSTLKIVPKGTGYLLGIAAGYLAYISPLPALTIATFLALGCLIHLAGDVITTKGLKLFRPLSSFNVRIPILGDAGSSREKALDVVLVLATVLFIARGAGLIG